MARLTRDALLGAKDLRTKEVELESIGGSVEVTGLAAAYANEAQFEAMEVKSDGREQIISVNTAKLEALQILHGLVDPKLNSLAEAERFMRNCGPAVRGVVDAIDELSAIDKEAIAEASAKFPGSGEGEAGGDLEDGAPAGNGRPAVSTRTGA